MIVQGSDVNLVFNIADINSGGIYDIVDATVSAMITKPSGEIKEIFCTILDSTNAKVEAYIDKKVLNEYGNYSFQLVVRKATATIISPMNGFYVGQNIGVL